MKWKYGWSVFATLSTLLVIFLPVTAHAATSSSTNATIYRVKNGDSLYKISNEFHISINSLEKANPQVHNNLIYPGEALSIPSKTASIHTSKTTIKQPASSSEHVTQGILHTAYKLQGIHYQWGGNSPATGFDCSGFIQYIFASHGIHLPRTANEQSKIGRPVKLSNLLPGDLMFFVDTYSRPTTKVTHVALYIGNGNVIESSSVKNQGVMIIHNILKNPWYRSRYYGARNVVENEVSQYLPTCSMPTTNIENREE